jgi:hypothetical protein
MKINKQIAKQNIFTEFFLYTTPNGKVKVEIFLRDENLWLTQKRMADLFGVGIPAINKHLKNIFKSNELQEDSVISIMEITAEDGKKYSTKFYNLDASAGTKRCCDVYERMGRKIECLFAIQRKRNFT